MPSLLEHCFLFLFATARRRRLEMSEHAVRRNPGEGQSCVYSRSRAIPNLLPSATLRILSATPRIPASSRSPLGRRCGLGNQTAEKTAIFRTLGRVPPKKSHFFGHLAENIRKKCLAFGGSHNSCNIVARNCDLSTNVHDLWTNG